MSNKHAQTLVGKYYRDPNSTDREWKVLDLKTAISFINKKIEVRSPITCQNPNFKICRKCFGEKNINTKYVGIVAGQTVVERRYAPFISNNNRITPLIRWNSYQKK